MKIIEAHGKVVELVTDVAAKFPGSSALVQVDAKYSVASWNNLIKSGVGTMFALFDKGKVIGGLGCVMGPNLHFPETIAVESFWYVDKNHRGKGLVLLKHFEEWAKSHGADSVAMIHMVDSMPGALEKLYTRRGYHKVEVHYMKNLKETS